MDLPRHGERQGDCLALSNRPGLPAMGLSTFLPQVAVDDGCRRTARSLAGRGDESVPGQVLRIRGIEAWYPGVVAHQLELKLADVRLSHLAGGLPVTDGKGGGSTDGLPADGAGRHPKAILVTEISLPHIIRLPTLRL